MRTAIKAAALAIVLSTPAAAGAPLAGKPYAAYAAGDFGTALTLLMPLAEQNDAKAQALIGAMYQNGEGVPADLDEAARWTRMAADRGDAGAQARLGDMFHDGEGLPKRPEEAVKWYVEAAHQGHAKALASLATMAETGDGMDHNPDKAAEWRRNAADRGHAASQYAVGEMYRSGSSVRRNEIKALMWFFLAENSGHQDAPFAIRELTRELSRGKVIQAERMAERWKPKTGRSGIRLIKHRSLFERMEKAIGVPSAPILKDIEPEAIEPHTAESEEQTPPASSGLYTGPKIRF